MSEKANSGEKNLTFQILIALVLGVLVGALWPEAAFSLKFIGSIFMAALKMLIMPLILFTMIVGVSSLGTPDELGKLGGKAIFYYISTTLLAIFVGLVAVNLMKPGQTPLPEKLKAAVDSILEGKDRPATSPTTSDRSFRAEKEAIKKAFSSYLKEEYGGSTGSGESGAKSPATKVEILSERAASNIVEVLKKYRGEEQKRRVYGAIRVELLIARVGMKRSLKEAEKIREQSNKTGPPLTLSRFLYMQIDKILQNPFRSLSNDNVLGVIVFSLALGLILVGMGDKGKPVLALADSLNDAMMKFVELVMKLTPYGVFSLISYQVAESGLDILLLLGKYMLCVLVALAVHALVVLPALLWIFGRRSPFQYFLKVRNALGIAFSTSSSSATLPVTIEVVEREAGVSPKVAGFVLPLGATVNMDGTALYEAIAAMFIAQIYGIDLGVGPQILIFLTAALAAIGAAGIPSAGTVTMVMVLSAVGLPLSGIGLILAVDRILDMCRTAVNVWGDTIGAAILDKSEKN